MVTFRQIINEAVQEELLFMKDEIIRKFNLGKKIKVVWLSNILLVLRCEKLARKIGVILVEEIERIKSLCIVESLDYTDIREEILQKCCNKRNVDNCYSFFYDETNNYRVFHIKNGKFNEDPTKYFILGGICFNKKNNPKIEQLEKELKLPVDNHEIKSKTILEKNDFLKCIGKKKLNVILKWLDKNDVFLHIEAVDHLKIIVHDIYKICCQDESDEGKRLIFENIFYKCAKMNLQGMLNILVKYNYPDIDKYKIKCFLEELREFLFLLKTKEKSRNRIEELGKNIFSGTSINALDLAIKNENINNYNGRDRIIEDYVPYYLIKPILFIQSEHIYDNEPEITKKLVDYKITIKNKELNNYRFIDSKSNRMVQISDVIVALISNFFKYANTFKIGDMTIQSIHELKNDLKYPLQRENFCLLMKLLRNSKKECELFIRINGDLVNINAVELLSSVTEVTNQSITLVPRRE